MTANIDVPETISRIIDVSTIGDVGETIVLEPTAEERAAIAKRLGVPAVKSLRGEFFVTPTRGGVDIKLNLAAVAERICVVSLEPLDEEISETIVLSFDRNYVEDEDDISDSDIVREPLDGVEIDVGELLVQHLSLALDPYPRKKSATPLTEKFRDAALSSPFSVLKGLADRES